MTPPIEPGGEECTFLSDVSPSDKPWDIHRAQTDILRDICKLNDEFERYAERMNACSGWLSFAQVPGDNGELTFKLQRARFCRYRHCPVCQWRRALMWRARFFQALPQLLNDYPKAEFLFLTLTVRHRPANELRQTLAQMNKAWTLLTKRKQFPGLGYVKSTEVTRSANGYAHAHFHVLIMVTDGYFKRGYLSKDKWIELWQSCLKVDYAPSVDVKKVRERGKAAEKSSDPNVARLKAICETLKYSIKPSDLVADPEWFYEINRQLHKTRAVAVGGLLKNYLSEEEPEDLIHSDLDEEEDVPEQAKEITFGWREMYKRYAHNKDA